MARMLQFANPSFYMRLKSMLGVDFYRLFHTPLLYIFIAIATIIPAMVSCLTMEHDVSDAAVDPVAVYKAIEGGVVGAYRAVEKGAVDTYRKVEDTMVDKLFRREGGNCGAGKGSPSQIIK